MPSVQYMYEALQKQNSNLESNISTATRELQFLTDQISFMSNKLDELRKECENEKSKARDLRHQVANMEAVVNEFKNNDGGEYTKIIRAAKAEVEKNLLKIRPLLELALLCVIQSMTNNPEKCSSLVSSNNPTSSRDYDYLTYEGQNQQSQYGDNSVEVCKTQILDQAKEFYTFLVDRLICEVVNGSVDNVPGTTTGDST